MGTTVSPAPLARLDMLLEPPRERDGLGSWIIVLLVLITATVLAVIFAPICVNMESYVGNENNELL